MLALAAELSQGAHPYNVPPEHTKRAREILGKGPLLCPDQKAILEKDSLVFDIIREDLDEMEARFADERRTEIGEAAEDFMHEDLIAEENVVVTVSREGYVKRTPVGVYRSQTRGGRGIAGGKSKDGDLLSHLFVTSTHDTLLIVTDFGRLYWLKVWQLPDLDCQTSKVAGAQ